MQFKEHKDLIVWQKAIDLAIEVYRISDMIPREETYALSEQMKEAAVSIPSNIAQGQDSNMAEERLRRLYFAKGSKGKLETQLLICVRLKYLTMIDIEDALALLSEIGNMLNTIIMERAVVR